MHFKCERHITKRLKCVLYLLKSFMQFSFELLRFLSHFEIVYDRNHYFGLGPLPKPKLKLANTFR